MHWIFKYTYTFNESNDTARSIGADAGGAKPGHLLEESDERSIGDVQWNIRDKKSDTAA